MRYRRAIDEYMPEGNTLDVGHNISTALDGDNEYMNTRIATLMRDDDFPHNFNCMVMDSTVPHALVDDAVCTYHNRANQKWLCVRDNAFIVVTARPRDGRVWLQVNATTEKLAKEITDEMTEALGGWTGAVVPEGQVRVNFWNMTPRGTSRRTRKLDMPKWEDIQGNYEHATATQISEFMTMKSWDDSRGKLIIWRGDPGLGKTYALRAMCQNWSEWASVHYIADPEQFLGDPDYLFQVMSFDPLEDTPGLAGLFDEDDDDDGDTGKNKNPITHRLIILEDAGELVGAEARAETGQALSRLLNAVDGMFGQGTKCVVMITTNEEKGKLHEAVGRHGRCAKDVTFQTFDLLEAADWLEANGADPNQATAGMSLSDLYAMKHEHINAQEARPKTIGFAS